MTIAVGGPYCQNCGRLSHCGGPYYEDFRNWKHEHMGQIKVCDSCRCESCARSNYELPPPGDTGC
jgi:hypothetical protein